LEEWLPDEGIWPSIYQSMPAMSGHEQSNLLQSFTKTPNRVGRPRKYGTVEEAKKHKAELQKEKRHRQQQEPRDPSPKSSRVFQFIQYHPPPTQLHTESLNNHDQYKQISSISQTHSAAISYPQQQYLEDIDQYIPRQRSSSRVLEYIVGTSNSKQTPYHKETVHIQADIATKEVATVLNSMHFRFSYNLANYNLIQL
jgi:hypothetical protein